MFVPSSDPGIARACDAAAHPARSRVRAGDRVEQGPLGREPRSARARRTERSVLLLQSTYFDAAFQRYSLTPGMTTPWTELVARQVPDAHCAPCRVGPLPARRSAADRERLHPRIRAASAELLSDSAHAIRRGFGTARGLASHRRCAAGHGLRAATLPFYTVGIFAPIFASQFGWSFAAIFGGLIVSTLVLLLGGAWIGSIIDRRGARTVAAASLAGLGLGYMTLALLDGSIAQYYVSWLILSVAGSAQRRSPSRRHQRRIRPARLRARARAVRASACSRSIVKPLAGWSSRSRGGERASWQSAGCRCLRCRWCFGRSRRGSAAPAERGAAGYAD